MALRIGSKSINHVFVGTKPVSKIYVGSDLVFENTNPPTITSFSVSPSLVDLDIPDNYKEPSITFVKRSTGIYHFLSSQLDNVQSDVGSVTGFDALADIIHYYIGTAGRLSGPPSDSHYYQFAVRNTDPNYQNYSAIEINGRDFALANSGADFNEHGITGREYWTTDRIPNSADWVTDSRLTLTIKFKVSKVPDRLSFSAAVTGFVGQATTAQIYTVPQGTKVGPAHVAGAGANISETVSNIERPSQSQTYRLLATNAGGAAHSDTVLTITQDATISNFRRSGFAQTPGTQSGRFQFSARITGYPRPAIRYRFGNGQQSQRDNQGVAFSPVAGQQNAWDIVIGGGAGITHAVLSDSIVLTATNSSGSATATIANISA